MIYEVEDNGAHTIKEAIASVALCAGDGPCPFQKVHAPKGAISGARA
jgi:hypothetical protein